MKMSDVIEQFLLEMLRDEADIVLKRNELANRFSCAPSQINYVIGTRFTGQRGYEVESQRGGGGYIRIRRVPVSTPRQLIMHTVNSIGEELDLRTAAAFLSNAIHQEALAEGEGRLILSALSDSALRPVPRPYRDTVRASLIKHMLLQTVND